MDCNRCGKSNPATATFCGFCGNQLPRPHEPPQHAATGLPQPPPGLKRTPVIVVILLTFITLGIYYPCWFLARRKILNNLVSPVKLGPAVFVVAILVYGYVLEILAALIISIPFTALRTEIYPVLSVASPILHLVAFIALLVQGFNVRRILDDHWNGHLERAIPLSHVWTFLFQIFYLQYKINRFL